MSRPKKKPQAENGDSTAAEVGNTKNKKKTPSTRVPSRLHEYMKSLSPIRGFRNFNAMKAALLEAFLAEEPWSRHGLAWRATRSRVGRDPDVPQGQRATGWVQENFYISQDLIDRIHAVLISEGVSRSSFLYTASFWWCWYVHPPEIEVRRRRQEGLPERADLTPAAALAATKRPAMAATKRPAGGGGKK